MDVDFIEIRNGLPVAVIEVSLCTPSFSNCKGQQGVFNRFLQETGGFQFELSWWVARWLDIPAFVVCVGDPDMHIHILSLRNGQTLSMSIQDYSRFICSVGSNSHRAEQYLLENALGLDDLVQLLKRDFPGMGRYPYFSRHKEWTHDYQIRLHEVRNRLPRQRPKSTIEPPNFPVKTETTGERPSDYMKMRSRLSGDHFNMQWVEWRKDPHTPAIGRPVAIMKTLSIEDNRWTDNHIATALTSFAKSAECGWWHECASRMAIRFYFVVYETKERGTIIGNKFKAYTFHDGEFKSKEFTEAEYRRWLCSL